MTTLNSCELTKPFVAESIWGHSPKESALKEAALILTMSRLPGHMKL